MLSLHIDEVKALAIQRAFGGHALGFVLVFVHIYWRHPLYWAMLYLGYCTIGFNHLIPWMLLGFARVFMDRFSFLTLS